MIRLALAGLITLGLMPLACKKNDDDDQGKKMKVKPQLLKLPTGDLSLHPGIKLVAGEGANAQSFTPTSIKLSLYSIQLVKGELTDSPGPNNSGTVYQCDGETAKDCLVEISNLQALTDALNSAPASIAEGVYTHVSATFCSSADNNKQLIEVTGSTSFGGKTYITDSEQGVIEGVAANATPVQFRFQGCASMVPLQKPITSETTAEQKAAAAEHPDDPTNDAYIKADVDISLQLLFDSRDFAMMGNMTNTATKELVTFSHPDRLDQIPFNDGDDAACKGSKDGLFVCAQRTAVYATDAFSPQIRRFAVALKDTEAQNDKALVAAPNPVVYTAVIVNDAGEPVASYSRRSVQFGAEFNMALPGDEDYMYPQGLSKNADGSYKLSSGEFGQNTVYEAFRLEAHEGAREVNTFHLPYKATLMD